MKILLSVIIFTSTSTAMAQLVSPRYELVKMDKTINTFRHEAAPIVSPDGNELYFFVQDHPDNTYGSDDTQDIWMSKKGDDGVWGPAEHLGAPFNIHRSNQVFTVLPNENLFIKGGRNKGEKGFSIATANGDLHELDVKDFKKMNKGRFYGATMSYDRKHIIMYFSETNNSTISDLYASHLQADGTYSPPVKLKLSTRQDDVGPFIGPDQKTLFFGSARQAPGRQGGVDIYKCTRLDDTWMNWSAPENLGKPINTGALDFYFTMDSQGNIFTSRANKALEGAQLDLYMLVPKTIHVVLAGKVLNEKTDEPLSAGIEVKIKDVEPVKFTSQTSGEFKTTLPEATGYTVHASASGFLPGEQAFAVPELYSDTTINIEIRLTPMAKELVLSGNVYDQKTSKPVNAKINISLQGGRAFQPPVKEGRFEQRISKPGWYILSASAEGYLNATDSIDVSSEELSPFSKDLYLQPIEVGVTVRLKNIYFDFDKTTLKKESFKELDKVVDFLNENPSVQIEIAGHTDNKGSETYNENLSQGRSQTVVDYIISQGIESYRLTAHGYGESKPIDTNDTEEGQANNRRVEFTVVKK